MTESQFKLILKPDQYQVFLFTCPASFPFPFARHPWFVVNNKGVISRWEVLWKPHKWETSWGYLHKDFYLPTQGIAKYFFSEKYLWNNIKLLGSVEGEIAERMAGFIENSPQSYPHCFNYSLKGPNSNTYIQWVLNQFPESNLSLPWNAFGKHKVSSFMKNTEKAFNWIMDIIERHGINYKISGGFAARVHGVKRELADIDIEMADKDILKIVDDVKPYIIFGPTRYKDESWDLELMTLKYEGQEIDIAGDGAMIFNKSLEQWEKCSSGLQSVELKEVFGRIVNIESRESLIAYKSKIGRGVDLEDVRQLTEIVQSSE